MGGSSQLVPSEQQELTIVRANPLLVGRPHVVDKPILLRSVPIVNPI